MIETENLTKKFDKITAVDNLSLEVKEGEIFGFLGPNGAGKTTTVRMLTCLIGPTSGTALVNGFRLGRDDMEIRRTVGILTEIPGLYDNLSAEFNLMIYAKLYDVQDPKGQVERYLRLMDLWDRRHDEAGTFSKGMKQKLAISSALLHEPRLIFLDEPTAGLDPESSRLVRNFISDLSKEGRTVFMCTHNLDEADRLCSHIGVFRSRLLVMETPDTLRSQLFGRKVVFHLRKVEDQVARLIQALPFVQETKAVDSKLIVTLDDPEAHNPEIIRALVDAGADIHFVGELRRSLEDVYLTLMKEEDDNGSSIGSAL
jgi:ABC-2 type transport system ATP-binding protein